MQPMIGFLFCCRGDGSRVGWDRGWCQGRFFKGQKGFVGRRWSQQMCPPWDERNEGAGTNPPADEKFPVYKERRLCAKSGGFRPPAAPGHIDSPSALATSLSAPKHAFWSRENAHFMSEMAEKHEKWPPRTPINRAFLMWCRWDAYVTLAT